MTIKESLQIAVRTIRNIFLFLPELSEYEKWDSEYLERFLSKMYRHLSTELKHDPYHKDSKKLARRAAIISHLIANRRDTIEDPMYNHLLDKQLSITTDLHGFIRVSSLSPLSKIEERLYNSRRAHIRAVRRDRDRLLLHYITKYHDRLWT
jgi:hypothetical protein